MTKSNTSKFDLINLDHAEPSAKALLEAARTKLGFVPNMYASMANFPPLLDTYIHGYELFRTNSGLTPVEQEVVFLAISSQNECEYCMAAHTFVARKVSKVPEKITQALRTGTQIPDLKLEALNKMATALVIKRGRADTQDIRSFLEAGYTSGDILALVLALSVKTISNYSNHILNTPLDDAFTSHAWRRQDRW